MEAAMMSAAVELISEVLRHEVHEAQRRESALLCGQAQNLCDPYARLRTVAIGGPPVELLAQLAALPAEQKENDDSARFCCRKSCHSPLLT